MNMHMNVDGNVTYADQHCLLLLFRPTMYSILEIAGIETPRHAILLRDEDGNPINTKFVELDDSVQIGDKVFQKPFVEKPVDAEDHNVYIYFPSAAGGGSQRLFRKVGDRSSVYSPVSSVRKEGSYIYEDFVLTDGTDVKVNKLGAEHYSRQFISQFKTFYT